MSVYYSDDHPKYGPCGCCLWTPPNTRRQSARAGLALFYLFNVAQACLFLYGMAHPGW